MSKPTTGIGTKSPPRETAELRQELDRFLKQPLSDFADEPPQTKSGKSITVGAVQWGVYAFFDYDDEPIYVGQTRESIDSRIGRHLTNQRTDAVAMSVLDPFEVKTVTVWPLPQYQGVKGTDAAKALEHLNRLERTVFVKLINQSRFKKILNEKDPPDVVACELPHEIAGSIVSENVRQDREHPDVRIARRAQTIARRAQIIAGRNVQGGLRRALATQAQRLAFLSDERFQATGGQASVESELGDEDEINS